jgi:hypothetical protein
MNASKGAVGRKIREVQYWKILGYLVHRNDIANEEETH